jgi:hypothetical protein
MFPGFSIVTSDDLGTRAEQAGRIDLASRDFILSQPSFTRSRRNFCPPNDLLWNRLPKSWPKSREACPASSHAYTAAKLMAYLAIQSKC